MTERRDKPRTAVLRIGFLDLKVSAGLSIIGISVRAVRCELGYNKFGIRMCACIRLCVTLIALTAVFTHSTMNACFMSLHVSMKT